MGKASRAKQEARRAREQGAPARPRRRLGYPLVIVVVVVLGVAAVWFARRPDSAPAAPPLTIPTDVVDSTTVPDGATTTVAPSSTTSLP